MPLPLSIAIVCKDNESTIGRTLESVRHIASEIVAVDSGSTDDTIPMLQAAGARVIESEWLGHVATKQLALEACTQDWILCIDSDESLLPRLSRHVERVVKTPVAHGYEINRKVYYRGKPLNHTWQPEWRLRLIKRAEFKWGGLDPHDQLQPLAGHSPTIARLQGSMRHDSIGDFATFLAKQAKHAETMARSMRREGKRGSVIKLATSPAGAFLKQILIKQAWRDGWAGWVAAASTGIATAMKHATLLELTRAHKTHPDPDRAY